jgi:hypothetical protein
MSGILQLITTLNDSGGFTPPVTPTVNFDPANLGAVPANGSTVNGYTITVSNAGGQIGYSSANGGIFTKTLGTDYMSFGPDLTGPNGVGGVSYSMFVAYRPTPTITGKTICNNNEAKGDWLLGSFGGSNIQWYQQGFVNATNVNANTAWQMQWITFDGSQGTNNAKIYYANGQTAGAVNAYTNRNWPTTSQGPNQVRLFSRSSGADQWQGELGVFQIFNNQVLTATQVNDIYNAYKSRYGV